jgi:transcription elongation factor GreA
MSDNFSTTSIDLQFESQVINTELSKQAEGLRSQIVQLDRDIKEEEEKKNKAAEEGDLRENAGYQTAMENLARMHVEMRNLDAKERAFKRFSGDYEPSGFIGLGTTVHLVNVSDRAREAKAIKLVPSDLGDASIRAVSIESPVGRALIGKTAGDIVAVSTQAKTIDYEVRDIY